MPDIFEALNADWHRDKHAVADGMRHLTHPHLFRHDDAPQPPKTCGQCHDGVIRVNGCTCGDGLPPHGHEPGCGYEECPNGCWDILHRHDGTQTPASQPVNLAADAAPAQEDTMSLATITDDVRADLTDGLDYAEGLIARLKAIAPGIIGTVDTVAGSTVGHLAATAAGAILPQPAEDILDGLIKDFVTRYGTPAATTTAAPAAAVPAAPAAPAPAQ